jgi:hypothetical protein
LCSSQRQTFNSLNVLRIAAKATGLMNFVNCQHTGSSSFNCSALLISVTAKIPGEI